MKVLTNLNQVSSHTKLHVYADFPTTPEEGMLVYKDDGILYIYNEIDTVLSWRPLNVKSRSYLHEQSLSSTSWTINHNLDSDDIIYFVYDLNDDRHVASDQTFTDSNNMTLTFTESINGRAVIFAIGDSYASSGGSGSGDVDLSSIDQNIIPETASTYDIGTSSKPFNAVYTDELFTSGSSIYVNNKKVLEDDSNTITVSTDPDQDLALKTTGTGDIILNSGNTITGTASGGVSYNIPVNISNKNYSVVNQSTNGNISFTASGGGNITFTNSGDSGLIQLNASGTNSEIDITATDVDINADVDVSGSLSIGGDLIVSGTTTTINTANLVIDDNVIVLNNGETGSGVGATDDGIAGIHIDRGDSSNAILIFDDSDDKWKCGISGGSLIEIGSGGTSEALISTSDVSYSAPSSNTIILCTLSGDQEVTLPIGSSGLKYNIKKVGSSGQVTITPNGTEEIDGENNKKLTVQYENITIVSDGTNWHIL